MSATRPLPSLFAMLGNVDAVHGAYYLGLHAWISFFGASPFSVRFPSAVAVGLAVAGLVFLAARLSTTRIAVVAGVIACLLPRVTYMGEEARPFAFSAAIAAWLTLLLVELIRRESPPRRLWIGYGLLFTLGIYVFLYFALFALVHAVILLRTRRGRLLIGRWFWVSTIAIAAAAPVIYWAIRERRQIAYLGMGDSQVTFSTILVTLWFGTWWFAVLAWSLILVAIALGTRPRWTRTVRTPQPDATRLVLPSLEFVAASWLLVPTLALMAGEIFWSGFTARYASDSAPAAALLMASGLAWLGGRRRWFLAAGTLVVVLASVPIYVSQREPYAKNQSDWADISVVLREHAVVGDSVAFDEGVRPSRRPRLALHTYPAGFDGLLDVTLRTPYWQNSTWYDRTYSLDEAAARGRLNGVRRLWLVEYASATSTGTYGIGALESRGFVKSAEFTTHRSVIYEFTR
ncbi:glycosyltransferase family 39 protein [Cryobacterium sp. M91]|uniref:glycosyltransferase family 39 protein n=1 Tax=Cryobacterium sp. M91 TaxID=2048294 RepID=UPI0013049CFA|nr:glycosyltransferase family 39 protein [Cryobacterium sp. M91]